LIVVGSCYVVHASRTARPVMDGEVRGELPDVLAAANEPKYEAFPDAPDLANLVLPQRTPRESNLGSGPP
jgi:hypothetical protein